MNAVEKENASITRPVETLGIAEDAVLTKTKSMKGEKEMAKNNHDVLKKKHFYTQKAVCNVQLIKEGFFYVVKVDSNIYTKTANYLFAVQVFNAI